MDGIIFLSALVVFIQTSFAFKIPDSGSAVANLWSAFDLQLQDAFFQAFDDRHVRSRRALPTQDIWTGFVPDLYQHREQLVVDSVEVLSSNKVQCQDGDIILLDSMQFRRKYYTSVTCGDRLSLYQINPSSTLVSLEDKILKAKAVSISHFKLFDPNSSEVLLFVLVLTGKTLEVYEVKKDKLELSANQQLIHEYGDVKVFDVNGAVYCTLIMKAEDSRIKLGIFELTINGGSVHFNLATSTSFSEDSPVQMCAVDRQAHMFHSDVSRDRLNIYLFDSLQNQIEHHQIIEAEKITDFQCFRIGSHHYLAFATFKYMKIFQYVSGFYEELQILNVEGVTTIKPLAPPTYRDDTFLLVKGFNPDSDELFIELLLLDASSLTFLPANASCSVEMDLEELPQILGLSDISCLATMGDLDITSLTSVIVDKQLLMVVSDQSSKTWLLAVNVHLDSVENPVARQLVEVKERMEATASAVENVAARSREYDEFAKGIVLYDSDVKVEGSWKIGTIEVPEMTLERLNQTKVDFNPEIWIPGLDVIVDDIQKKMAELERLLNHIDDRLQGTIINGTHDAVDFEQLTIDGSLLVKQIEVTKLSVEKLNDLHFDDVMADIVRQDSDRMIESLRVMGTLTTDALTADRVNDVIVKDAVVRSDENIQISGDLVINGSVSVFEDVTVGRTVNGIDISNGLLTSNDNHESIIFIDNLSIGNLSVGGYLNGVHATKVLPNVVVNQTIDAHLDRVHFDHLEIEGDLDIKSGMVNDINIVSLNASAIRLDADQLVEGSMVFTKGIIAEKILQVGTINGINFEDLMLKNSNLDNVTMTGEKTFLGNVTARSLHVESTVNGHNLHNALTLDTNQTVKGNVSMVNGFEIPNGDLTILTLNDVDWKAVQEKGVHPAIFERQGVKLNVTIRNLCSIGSSLSTTRFKVNGEPLDDILNDIVYINGDEIVITGEKTFSSLKVNGLQVDGYINDLKVLDEILTSNTDQTITGNYEFRGYVDFSSLDVKGRLNEYNLDELLGSVLQFDGDLESVSCRLRFNHVKVSDQFFVNGSINGFPTELMVLDGVDQTFTAPQKLVSPDFSSLTINGHLNLTDPRSRINGIDLDLFDRRRVTIFTDQWIKGNWKLESLEADSLSFRTLNGLTLNEWNSSFIYAHSPKNQTIEAKEFNVDLLEVWGNITTFLNKVSGHDLSALSKVAGDIRKNLTFNTDVAFDHLEAKQVDVGGNVNHYSIQRLYQDVVYRNSTPLITGVKTFRKLTVKGDVEVDLINGRRLIDSYLHASADQTIETPIRFTDQVTAGDLQLVGDTATLNGVPKQLLFSDHTLDHNIHKGDVIIEQPIEVNSLEILMLQNENWDQLVSSLARLNETNHFNGSVTFTRPVEFGGALTVDKLNGVDIKKFSEDVVLVDVDANITSRKVFENLGARKLSTGHVQSDSVFPDVINTAAQAIRLDVNDTVNGTIQFADVTIERNIQSSTLNGQPFPAGYVTLDSSQELPNSMVVDKIVMLGDLVLEDGARVNGFDLNAECANTWMIDGADKIQSSKIFQGQIQLLTNLTVTQKVNGVADFDREVIRLATGGTIYGAPHFTDISVSGDIVNVGFTNDIDLADLATRALYLDRPIKTGGVWSMSEASLHGGSFLLPEEAKINNNSLNVGQLSGVTSVNDPRLLKAEEKNVYEVALQWRNALRHAYFKLDHLDINQTIFLPHQVTALSELQLNGTSFLFVGTRGGSIVYRRKQTESSYTLAGIPPDTGNVSKWLPLVPDFAASLSTSGTKLWQISSVDPFRIELIKDFGIDVVDITDEAIHGLRFSGNATRPNSTASLSGLQVYERLKTPAEVSAGAFNSDVKMHNFRLGSRSMIALIMTFSADVSANVVGCPGVRLYSTSTGSMKLEHIIPACDVRAITTFSHGNLPDNYLLLAEHESVTVYHYEGASGYRERFRMPYPTASALHSWSVKSGGDTDLLVAVGKADRVAIHKGVTVGDYIGE